MSQVLDQGSSIGSCASPHSVVKILKCWPHPTVYPTALILHPGLLLNLSTKVWASGLVDGPAVHCQQHPLQLAISVPYLFQILLKILITSGSFSTKTQRNFKSEISIIAVFHILKKRRLKIKWIFSEQWSFCDRTWVDPHWTMIYAHCSKHAKRQRILLN